MKEYIPVKRELKHLRMPDLLWVAMALLTTMSWIACDSHGGIKKSFRPGDIIDSLNGVYVYYNGSISNVSGRNIAPDGYNLGQKYQCVEFVKRYYYQHLKHRMPDSYGHAKDFFDHNVSDGKRNHRRNLLQFTNPSQSKPMVNDLLVFGRSGYGHVAIISAVRDNEIEVIQQNMGAAENSRMRIPLQFRDNQWHIKSGWAVGWLRKG